MDVREVLGRLPVRGLAVSALCPSVLGDALAWDCYEDVALFEVEVRVYAFARAVAVRGALRRLWDEGALRCECCGASVSPEWPVCEECGAVRPVRSSVLGPGA
jgi:hypothetical protein